MEAQADDDEFAEHVLSLPMPPDPGPRVSEYTPEVAALTDIKDRLAELIATVIATAGSKPPRIRPSRRPTTAIDRARVRARTAQHDALVAEVAEAQERYAATHN